VSLDPGTAGAEVMAAGEDAEVANHVKAHWRDEGAQPVQELLGGHVGVGGPAAPGSLEVDAHAAVGESGDGIMGEGRAQQVAADPFETLAVTVVTAGRCMPSADTVSGGGAAGAGATRAGRRARAARRPAAPGPCPGHPG